MKMPSHWIYVIMLHYYYYIMKIKQLWFDFRQVHILMVIHHTTKAVFPNEGFFRG